TEDLFRACAATCAYTIPAVLASPPAPPPKNAAQEDVGVGEGFWVTPTQQGGLGLDVTFNSWAQVVMLHMYILTVRLRGFPQEHAKIWHQNLLDHFFYAAEDRMAVWHGMSARSVRNKHLKDLWLQWRGLLLSYDEGLINGDAVMGAA
ncbi:Serine carboxypeptidase 3, partial [Teratosphaeriaceae sp. CCFEE 6253]